MSQIFGSEYGRITSASCIRNLLYPLLSNDKIAFSTLHVSCDGFQTVDLPHDPLRDTLLVVHCAVLLMQHAITMILLIPNEKRVVGIVVGRHGLRLKKILDTSHCTITVEK